MDVILVGLPGSGKSAVGRRLAQRHKATFLDLDDRIESADGRSIPTIFADDGEAAFRDIERRAVAGLGPPDPEPTVRRVIATGGGATGGIPGDVLRIVSRALVSVASGASVSSGTTVTSATVVVADSGSSITTASRSRRAPACGCTR